MVHHARRVHDLIGMLIRICHFYLIKSINTFHYGAKYWGKYLAQYTYLVL